jgi:polyhydroxyalkanoate synthesis regulator phasin
MKLTKDDVDELAPLILRVLDILEKINETEMYSFEKRLDELEKRLGKLENE